MFCCIDPGMAAFMAETPSEAETKPGVAQWVALAATCLLAVTSLLVLA